MTAKWMHALFCYYILHTYRIDGLPLLSMSCICEWVEEAYKSFVHTTVKPLACELWHETVTGSHEAAWNGMADEKTAN